MRSIVFRRRDQASKGLSPGDGSTGDEPAGTSTTGAGAAAGADATTGADVAAGADATTGAGAAAGADATTGADTAAGAAAPTGWPSWNFLKSTATDSDGLAPLSIQ